MMKKFQRNDRFGSDRGGRDSRPTSMHQAVCDDCGKKCEVPFRPTGDRPVYCNDCFGKQQGDSNSNTDYPRKRSFDRPERSSFDRPSFGDRQKFSAICAKCGKRCEVPFRPSGEKPVYCNDCFSHDAPSAGSNRSRTIDTSADQLAQINVKLDRLIAALMPKAEVIKEKKETAKELVIEEVKPKSEKAKAKKEKAVIEEVVVEKKKAEKKKKK